MPIAYLDVPIGAELAAKQVLVGELYEALHETYPFPDDTRIFIREWPLEGMSQNGVLGHQSPQPVFTMHVPQGGEVDAKRKMMRKIDAAVTKAYPLPEFITFMHEHSLDTVAVKGEILADDAQRVEDQNQVYGEI